MVSIEETPLINKTGQLLAPGSDFLIYRVGLDSPEFISQLFIIRGREGSGPSVIGDTTYSFKHGYVMTRTDYLKLIFDRWPVSYLPTTEGLITNPQAIYDQVVKSRVAIFHGGEDPGIVFRGNHMANFISGWEINPLRDRLDNIFNQAVIARGHEIFSLRICRGLELLLGPNLQEADSINRPPRDSKDEVTMHKITKVIGTEDFFPYIWDRDLSIPSNHHLSATKMTQEMIDGGWRVYYINPADGSIALTVRIDNQGVVTGLGIQDHWEKFPCGYPAEQILIPFVRRCLANYQLVYGNR